MKKKNYKGRTEKRALGKCEGLCRFYSDIQSKYADKLQEREDIASFRCNVLMDTDDYTTDFVITKTDGDLMVRECVERKLLMRPTVAKMLDLSREYWMRHGVKEWGLVIDAE